MTYVRYDWRSSDMKLYLTYIKKMSTIQSYLWKSEQKNFYNLLIRAYNLRPCSHWEQNSEAKKKEANERKSEYRYWIEFQCRYLRHSTMGIIWLLFATTRIVLTEVIVVFANSLNRGVNRPAGLHLRSIRFAILLSVFYFQEAYDNVRLV